MKLAKVNRPAVRGSITTNETGEEEREWRKSYRYTKPNRIQFERLMVANMNGSVVPIRYNTHFLRVWVWVPPGVNLARMSLLRESRPIKVVKNESGSEYIVDKNPAALLKMKRTAVFLAIREVETLLLSSNGVIDDDDKVRKYSITEDK